MCVTFTIIGQCLNIGQTLVAIIQFTIGSSRMSSFSQKYSPSTYGIHYLRISEKQVLPLILYIKSDNTNWFNDVIFQVRLNIHIYISIRVDAGIYNLINYVVNVS